MNTFKYLEVSPNSQLGVTAENRSESAFKMPRVSCALAALLLFLLINFSSGRLLGHCIKDRFALQNRDGCWWAVRHFKDLTYKPDIVLAGSSLMCRIINEGDATFLNRSINALAHYRCEHLEQLLSSDKPIKTASLAVGGMNASDVDSLIPSLLMGSKKPAAIVYGIGPRDLFDNSLVSPADTSPYKLAQKIGAVSDQIQMLARPTREAKFKYKANKILY